MSVTLRHTFDGVWHYYRTLSIAVVTGAAGFIGSHVSRCLLARGYVVVGIDNINEYYDRGLKLARLATLKAEAGFSFVEQDIFDKHRLLETFERVRPDVVIHLAAQAGVRYSISNPSSYADSNLTGFLNVIEGCRAIGVKHLVFASSSSVYGANSKVPFSVTDRTDWPVSLYAATKRANELMAYTYSHLYGIPTTGLRLFTVYGPWGRPDMAYFKFTQAILEGTPIDVYGDGKMMRDFTYVADTVEAIVRCVELPAEGAQTKSAPYRLLNVGSGSPALLSEMIAILEELIGKKAQQRHLPIQPGDVPSTYADISELTQLTEFIPQTSLMDGLRFFYQWYEEYYLR